MRPGYLKLPTDVIRPDENLARLHAALAAGTLPQQFAAAMERCENALAAIGDALLVAQPARADGRYAVRWWHTGGASGALREPVLVRDVRHGKRVGPERVRKRNTKRREDGAFALNADLVPGLLESYWQMYGEWRRLRELWTRLRRIERAVAAIPETGVEQRAKLSAVEARRRLAMREQAA